MSTMNISLPGALKEFVDSRIATGSYGSSSEYVRELIRKDQERLSLREMILAGATSEMSAKELDGSYFEQLRGRARTRKR